jgi:hypothetical protein
MAGPETRERGPKLANRGGPGRRARRQLTNKKGLPIIDRRQARASKDRFPNLSGADQTGSETCPTGGLLVRHFGFHPAAGPGPVGVAARAALVRELPIPAGRGRGIAVGAMAHRRTVPSAPPE